MADLYSIPINNMTYNYKCICHKDWHDLQMKFAEIQDEVNIYNLIHQADNSTLTDDEKMRVKAITEEMMEIQNNIVLKYTIEPHFDTVDDMDEYVYSQLLRAILDKANPKNSPAGIPN